MSPDTSQPRELARWRNLAFARDRALLRFARNLRDALALLEQSGIPIPEHLEQGVPMSGIDTVWLIQEERDRQCAKGYDAAHDDEHPNGELLDAARAYLAHALCVYAPSNPAAAPGPDAPESWPWDPESFRPSAFADGPGGAVRDLVKAGALIAAEIERVIRSLPATE